MATTFLAVECLFSCELEGSTASLLGTGVMLTVRLTFDMELDLEVSVRHGKRASFLGKLDEGCRGVGVAPEEEFGVVPAALEKKPRMLCCLPVEDAAWLEADRAGVRAEEADWPAMVEVCTESRPNAQDMKDTVDLGTICSNMEQNRRGGVFGSCRDNGGGYTVRMGVVQWIEGIAENQYSNC